MLYLLATTVALVTDPCAPQTSCTDCIKLVSQGCGWCSPGEVVYTDGTKGNRCAYANDPKKWFCLGKYMTAECEIGYVCTGPPDYKCELSGKPGEGTVDLHACIDTCVTPSKWKCNTDKFTCEVCTKGDDPTKCNDHQKCADSCIDESLYQCDPVQAKCVKCPSGKTGCQGKAECDGTCTQKYECDIPADITKGQPTCKKCSDPTGTKCAFASNSTCMQGDGKTSFGCGWQYECQHTANGPACMKTAHGIPKLEWCEQQCHSTYTCDSDAKMCKLSNSSSGGQPFTNKTQCDAQCPTKATNSTPYELRGVWRGLAIQNKFGRVEWVANVTANTTKLIAPDGSTYFYGTTQTFAPTGSGAGSPQLWVDSVEGTLKGAIKLIYNDYNVEPELSYVALAVDESAAAVPPTAFDAAMVKSSDKVFGMYKCKSSSKNCKFHLKTTTVASPPALQPGLLGRLQATPTGDACNNYNSDCKTCIGATHGDLTCGWCTSDVVYTNNSGATGYQCAGFESGKTHSWKCYGQYRTATCNDYCCDPGSGKCSECAAGKTGFPTSDMCSAQCTPSPEPYSPCGLNGTYRGLAIDLGYVAGEWTADFDSNKSTAKFAFVSSGYSFEGTMGCKAEDKDDGTFELKLTNGTTFYGLYAMGGNQAETEGLSLAFSQKGATVPPFSWDAAMLGVNATVYGFTKCASYKAAVCVF